MWQLLFILALLFVGGTALILLRTANIPRIPDHLKARPYDRDKTGGW
ncbi:MAG: hypothetical protein ACU841_17725 [Gammaproteobacteria bacterium]